MANSLERTTPNRRRSSPSRDCRSGYRRGCRPRRCPPRRSAPPRPAQPPPPDPTHRFPTKGTAGACSGPAVHVRWTDPPARTHPAGHQQRDRYPIESIVAIPTSIPRLCMDRITEYLGPGNSHELTMSYHTACRPRPKTAGRQCVQRVHPAKLRVACPLDHPLPTDRWQPKPNGDEGDESLEWRVQRLRRLPLFIFPTRPTRRWRRRLGRWLELAALLRVVRCRLGLSHSCCLSLVPPTSTLSQGCVVRGGSQPDSHRPWRFRHPAVSIRLALRPQRSAATPARSIRRPRQST